MTTTEPTIIRHAHWESEAQDCDGRISSSTLYVQDADQDDYDFDAQMLGFVVSMNSEDGRLDVRQVDGQPVLNWSESNDEGGGRHVEVTICTEACDLNARRTYRDHRAESMGY